MVRDLIEKYGSAKMMLGITLISIVISISFAVGASALYGFADLYFVAFISGLIPLILAPIMFFPFIKFVEEISLREANLNKALENVKTLQGLLPICATCNKIQDEKGNWKAIEDFFRNHTNVEFSHGICPDCAEDVYNKHIEGNKE